MADPRPLRYALLTGFTPSGPSGVLWDQPGALSFDYLNVGHWIALARQLEAARFDAIFWADHSGVHDVYRGGYETAVREAVQFPSGDPLLLTAALATSTQHLGFVFSANVIADKPYSFARRLTTLDHLTSGRIGWNVVTSFQPSAWRNLGFENLASHEDRYGRADEFLTVVFKLLQGSWEDNSVVRDRSSRRYAEPAKVHAIDHAGPYYDVPGIHTAEPSPQRVPVLFQAGGSDQGRDFAARNAEAIFLMGSDPERTGATIEKITAQVVAHGRQPSDVHYFQSVSFVVGSTEEEARRRDREIAEYASDETKLTMMSSTSARDLSSTDLDAPITDFDSLGIQGTIRALQETSPHEPVTFRKVLASIYDQRVVGTPEQIADRLSAWRDAGVTGVNVSPVTGMGDFATFLDEVTPLLRARGLMQREYHEGTFREKLFADLPQPSGPYLNERHPGSAYHAEPRA